MKINTIENINEIEETNITIIINEIEDIGNKTNELNKDLKIMMTNKIDSLSFKT